MSETYTGWFIYNTVTGVCWSDKLYYKTPASSEKLKKDFDAIQKLKPTMAMGEAVFDKKSKKLIEQNPADIRGVKYPKEARAERVLHDPSSTK